MTKNITKMTKEEFCKEYYLTENQFLGKDIIKGVLFMQHLKELPSGSSVVVIGDILLNSLEELKEGTHLRADTINLDSLKKIPSKDYSIDADEVTCNIILPTFKGSHQFYFGLRESKLYFKDYDYIRANPSEYLESSDPLENHLADFFLKNTTEESPVESPTVEPSFVYNSSEVSSEESLGEILLRYDSREVIETYKDYLKNLSNKELLKVLKDFLVS